MQFYSHDSQTFLAAKISRSTVITYKNFIKQGYYLKMKLTTTLNDVKCRYLLITH